MYYQNGSRLGRDTYSVISGWVYFNGVLPSCPAMGGCPDPDLAIICGPISSLLGYPPWQMRLAEIL